MGYCFVNIYKRPEIVFAIGGVDQVKSAALYFDSVIPFVFSPVPNEILPDHLNKDEKGLKNAKFMIAGLFAKYLEAHGVDFETYFKVAERIIDDGAGPAIVMDTLDSLLSDLYLEKCGPIRRLLRLVESIGSHDLIPILTPSGGLNTEHATVDDISITLAQLDLIDVSKSSWEQIIEFRKDAVACSRLRRLRLFMHQEFTDKSRDYIEDKILVMLEDYREAAKSNGFMLRKGVITQICNSKSLVATAGASLAAVIAGSPLTAGVAAIAGMCIEIANIVLVVADKKHEFSKVASSHNVAYIFDAKRHFEIPNA